MVTILKKEKKRKYPLADCEINSEQLSIIVYRALPADLHVCALYQAAPQSTQWTLGPKDFPKALLRPPLCTKK